MSVWPVFSSSAQFLAGDDSYQPPVVRCDWSVPPESTLENKDSNVVLELMVREERGPGRVREEPRQNKKPKLSLVDSLLQKYERPMAVKAEIEAERPVEKKKPNPFKK